jgi:hypothetical protein
MPAVVVAGSGFCCHFNDDVSSRLLRLTVSWYRFHVLFSVSPVGVPKCDLLSTLCVVCRCWFF